ncbi:MAG: CRISPR-associated helicase Cas3' [Acidobacteria bacterium]|nr:CRISPR-associated helicase Cas3' [Acidobacteriota bacterium]
MAELNLNTDNIFRFWAKLPHDKDNTNLNQFHPLICHMLDVAAATRELWRLTFSIIARERITKAFGLTLEQTEQWIMFLAALHDLGKASPAFQLRPEAKHLFDLINMGQPPIGIKPSDIPHGRVTAGELPNILKQELNINKKLACQIAKVIGGHHGTFPTSLELQQNYRSDGAGKTPWIKVRNEFVKLLIALFKLNELPISQELEKTDNAISMIVAGLVSVADWIGSNSDFFHYQIQDYTQFNQLPSFDIQAYLQKAEKQACEALNKLGWLGWSQASEPSGFSDLFPKIENLRPLQNATINLAEKLDSPSIVIVEAPMGEGKTEAALYLADKFGVMPGPRGFYIALPTQATSNQMFYRTKLFLEARYPAQPVHLQLLHGHSSLSAEFRLMKERAEKIFHLDGVYSDDDKNCCAHEMNVIAAEWFTHRKRGLLAPFGVGTVDQALLAILQTRHVFVRLFGLSHKVVIIDEVHAYDVYMSQLLERLLEWLAVLGSPVILLSATLPKSRRNALLAAYYRGLNLTDTAADTSKLNQSYPCISWATKTELNSQTIAVSEQIRRTLTIDWVNGLLPKHPEEKFELGEKLSKALADGGCAAVICNTVARAQEVYKELKNFFANSELHLFHARYFFKDRDVRETKALALFGKNPENNEVINPNRPNRAVIVATQVIEQSLDLDFDLMVTDIAPIDLVLQRSGRLHRHKRSRLSSLATPTLWICRPEISENVPKFDYATEKIYDLHILLRTWLSLINCSQIQIPNDIENLIESAYDQDLPCPTTLSAQLQGVWKSTKEEQIKELHNHQTLAKDVIIPSPKDKDDILEKCYKDLKEDQPELNPKFQALTRLTEPSIPIVLLTPDQCKFIDEKHIPNLEETKLFLAHSLNLQHKGLVHELLKQSVLEGWQKSALLRNHRLIKLNNSSRWESPTANYEIVLDEELGIVINSLKKC